jgi:hypothetical protein
MNWARCTRAAAAVALAGAAAVSVASPGNGSIDLPLYDGADGVSCRYFNRGAVIPWRREGGDWIDRAGALHGDAPRVSESVRAENRIRPVRIDVTELAGAKLQASRRRLELVLREVSGRNGGTMHFFSRESAVERRPRLLIEFVDGQTASIAPIADAQISCSTYRGLGPEEWLSVGPRFSTVLAFDLKGLPATLVKNAVLELTSRDRQYGDVTIGAFELASPLRLPIAPSASPTTGIAARYAGDAGLARDPAVMLFEDFESADWRGRWSEVGGDIEVVGAGSGFGFEPFAGRALRVRIAEGRDIGASVHYHFRDKRGREPEEAYFRYMLRFGDDWRPVPESGKLPGFAATYGRAAWGGRRADGTNGWSARGWFSAASAPANPLHQYSALGFYTYHADMRSTYGDIWPWTERTPALLLNNRWYAVEQQVRLNTPGQNDGVLRAWLDGQLVFERTDVRFRHIADLRIEELWLNVYFGGTRPSARTMHLFIDNVVLADRYIGPVTARTSKLKSEAREPRNRVSASDSVEAMERAAAWSPALKPPP